MHPSELFDELKRCNDIESDAELANLIGLTSTRISLMRSGKNNLSARQLASYIQKAKDRGRQLALVSPIRPIVEMYPINAAASRQGTKWELLPTGKDNQKNQAIQKLLEDTKGLFLFYDSYGCAIYVGKTEKLNIWKEMTWAFNRERPNHRAFFVDHPANGLTFSPAWKTPRQPQKKAVHLYDIAHYFSAYEVAPALIPKLQALVVRAFFNRLANEMMERF